MPPLKVMSNTLNLLYVTYMSLIYTFKNRRNGCGVDQWFYYLWRSSLLEIIQISVYCWIGFGVFVSFFFQAFLSRKSQQQLYMYQYKHKICKSVVGKSHVLWPVTPMTIRCCSNSSIILKYSHFPWRFWWFLSLFKSVK